MIDGIPIAKEEPIAAIAGLCVSRARVRPDPPCGRRTALIRNRGLAMHLGTRAVAEFLGTFWLTFGGCGSAVIAAAYPELGIGFVGVALAFGLTVVTMAY